MDSERQNEAGSVRAHLRGPAWAPRGLAASLSSRRRTERCARRVSKAHSLELFSDGTLSAEPCLISLSLLSFQAAEQKYKVNATPFARPPAACCVSRVACCGPGCMLIRGLLIGIIGICRSCALIKFRNGPREGFEGAVPKFCNALIVCRSGWLEAA